MCRGVWGLAFLLRLLRLSEAGLNTARFEEAFWMCVVSERNELELGVFGVVKMFEILAEVVQSAVSPPKVYTQVWFTLVEWYYPIND